MGDDGGEAEGFNLANRRIKRTYGHKQMAQLLGRRGGFVDADLA
jgi:hypothetical protein